MDEQRSHRETIVIVLEVCRTLATFGDPRKEFEKAFEHA
jgi:hypothetical protein